MVAVLAGALAIVVAWLSCPGPAERPRARAPVEEGSGGGDEPRAEQGEPAFAAGPAPARAGAAAPEASPEPAAAPAVEPGPADPGAVEITDRVERRFRVRWGERGLCGPDDAPRLAHRAALLATFVAMDADGTTVRHDPLVDAGVLRLVESVLRATRSSPRSPLGRLLGPEAERVAPPEVYVYRDAQQLLDGSCVNGAAIGYYDGAIHVSGDVRHGFEAVRQTLVHEHVHHVLVGLGIRVPTWLHEGLAMKVAGETWWLDPALGLVPWLEQGHLPFEAMTGAFPHTADETFALASYYQSLSMLEFLSDRRGEAGVAALVQALARGDVDPRSAFSWATGASGDALEQAWGEFVTRRRRQRDDPMQELEATAARNRR